MKRLASFAYTRRRLVVAGWIVLLVGLFVISSALKGQYRTDFKLPGSESQQAFDLLKAEGVTARTGFSGQIVFKADAGVNDPAVKQTMEKFFGDIKNAVNVEIVSPYDPANAYQISKDGKIAYAQLNFSDRSNEQYRTDGDAIKAIHNDFVASAPQGLQVELGGDLFADQPAFNSELVGIIAAVVILLIAFGSFLAMGLPIVTALFGIGCGAALIGLATRLLAVPDFTTQVAAMIGIGVGIDYALLIVTRYRSGLHDGLTPHEAASLAIDTSGRAVLFAGITVVISLLGMFLLNLDFMRSMSIGAVLAVLMTMLGSLTLLPAMLGFVGHNIDRPQLRLPRPSDAVSIPMAIARAPLLLLKLPSFFVGLFRQAKDGGNERRPHALTAEQQVAASFWYKWSRVIQKYPWPALVLSAGLLIALASPVFALRLGFGDAGNRQTTDTTRRSYDLLSEGFGPGFNAPFLLVLETPGGQADTQLVADVKSAIAATPGVASVADPQPVANGQLQLLNVFATTAPQDKATTQLVHELRDKAIPPVIAGSDVHSFLTGQPPAVVDFSDYMGQRLPIFIGAVLLLSFLLLMTVFHSVVVPLKAVIMNMLSIGAAFGAMVGVFQWGIGASIIGLGKEGPIEAWAPMFIFAIVFGLSMDYEVFLLTRVREEYDRTGDNGRAVADGLAATGRVISAAAMIMVCVFGSFILGADRSLKLIGFGLAFAVFIDATVVRLMLVPSAMELLGRANWWAPAWLVRYLPTIRVDSDDIPVAAPSSGGGS
jgi:RND superfamily putative drug exporter